uniref:Uncharacterized protein n=1 Tax=Compsopogon caeruleus TaxID=31354 RepID=A0A7S1TD90_9RHOD|mmetsp:Transcript_18301/g.38241  ORF Transcript_18301/g.38241 Transcript_18301/m.38241 type:complete len:161 (+) Transcript_18301:262-744(+)|eukprot:CAMPEP_0184677488 /NCGR_PEP_ID=MMETSP0312-20130426/73_1 /TAXON_ID=31354 /ORGANISM="Compsopogon coeruleus, Strain SAG 36.94" /LENGTH=160 /DNA_ID=CAMNT_0027125395 /DNA_START=242 /DNA_END=724 /DNA_ORIENTATION=-
MAFVGGALWVPVSSSSVSSVCTMKISVGSESLDRRQFLQWAVVGVSAVVGAPAVFAYDKVPGTAPGPAKSGKPAPVDDSPKLDSLETLESEVEKIKYEEELFLNPEPAEDQKYRTKKPKEEEEYEKEKKQLEAIEKERVEEEREEEEKENEEIRRKFGKK